MRTAIVIALLTLLPHGLAADEPEGHPVTGTDDCGRCHTSEGWRRLPDEVPFDHDATGFPLRGQHGAVACRSCHGAGLQSADGTPRECARCHEDRHEGRLGRQCEQCHSPKGWRIPTVVVDHRTTRFPLVGAHIAADCTACHVRGRQETYTGVSTHCFACHADEYRRADTHPNHVKAGFTTSCDYCHTQYTWEMPRLRHELFFPLQGGHAGAACTDCHRNERYGGTSRACASCHMNDYVAAKDPPHQANRMSTDCGQCHTPIAWEALAGGWHEPAFPIDGGDHGGFSCGQCHVRKGSYLDFSCTVCHGKSATNGIHGGMGGYVWESFTCYACHPRGEE
jgi:hypothetical protein